MLGPIMIGLSSDYLVLVKQKVIMKEFIDRTIDRSWVQW
jgi:hypothetical protein